MGYSMYAYASNGGLMRNVTLTSICNTQNEINEQTPPPRGNINALSHAFADARKPAPVNFTWKHQSEVCYDG